MSDLDALAAARQSSYRRTRKAKKPGNLGVILWIVGLAAGLGGLGAYLWHRDTTATDAAVQQVIAQQAEIVAARAANEAAAPTTGGLEGRLQLGSAAGAMPANVALIRATFSRDAASRCLNDAVDRWQTLANEQQAKADELRDEQTRAAAKARAQQATQSESTPNKSNAVFDVPHDLKTTYVIPGRNQFDDKAALARQHAKGLQAIVAALPEQVSPADLYGAVARHDDVSWPAFDAVVQANVIGFTSMDADGSYKFPPVEPGAYYVYAATHTEQSHAEWLSPVRVTVGQTSHIDLVNHEETATPAAAAK